MAAAPALLPLATRCQFGIDVATLGTADEPQWDTFPEQISVHRAVFRDLDLPHVRIFQKNAAIPTWADARYRALRPGDHPVMSFKARTLPVAAFNAWMSSIPADVPEAWACAWHECEDNIEAGQLTVPEYLALYQAMHDRRALHPNGHKVRLVKIFMRYQQQEALTPATRWQILHGGQMFVDALGLDCYDPKARAGRGYSTGPELLGIARQMGAQTGLNWCVPELGAIVSGSVPRQDGGPILVRDDGSMRYRYMRDEWIPYLKATRDGAGPALWANWWCAAGNEGTGFDYHLDTWPGVRAIWRTEMAASQ